MKRDAVLNNILPTAALFVAALVVLGLIPTPPQARAQMVAYKEMAPGVNAQISNGSVLHLYCRIPEGAAAKSFLSDYLADPASWTRYQTVRAAAIPFDQLNGKTQRQVLMTIFTEDYVDENGWWHTVVFEGAEGTETWRALSVWLTGSEANVARIQAASQNRGLNGTLAQGQRVFIPRALLLPVMQTPTERPTPTPAPVVEALNGLSRELEFDSDGDGEHAIYILKPGEAIYTSVVARFTDFRESADVLEASKEILARSGISNARNIKPGQEIKIPVSLLSGQYRPAGTPSREEYEAMRQEAARLSATRSASKGLEGVVIILDSGHGGDDDGASHFDGNMRFLEDEINYDMVSRIKELLERTTSARVYVTVQDLNDGYTPVNRNTFVDDSDEVLLTTPPHKNDTGAKSSANLRFYLANEIYRKERARGTPDTKMLFASIHCDKLYYKMRGTMVYVPGARYRRTEYTPSGTIYGRYEESKKNPTMRISPSTFGRDEALSHSFASVLVDSLRNHRVPIKVHDMGDPIRNVIRQSGGRAYNPAVLNYTLVPTKVLVETANLGNATDRQRLADPDWRQWYAEAFVEALKTHFKASE